jgi:tetratricopeptide (TPR) repeat protein
VADGEESYQFAHDVIREVLEQEGDVGSVGQLAYHYTRSTEFEKALFYLERAGDHALSLHANAEAEDYFWELATRLESMDRKDKAAQAWEKLGGVLRLLARHNAARLAFEKSTAIYRLLDDVEGVGRATAQIGWVHARQGTPQQGLATVKSFLSSLRSDSELTPRTLATLEVVQAELCLVSGRYSEQLQAAERATKLAYGVEESPLIAQAEMRQGTAYFNLGQSEKARRLLLHAIEVARQTGDLWSLCRAFNAVSTLNQFLGAFDEAAETSRHALEAAEQLGDPTAIAYIAVISGDTSFYLGSWDAAHQHFERAAQLMRQVGPSWVSPFPLLALGSLALSRGQYEHAEDLLAEAVTLAEGIGELQALRYAQRALAERDMLMKNSPSAVARLVPLLDRRGQQETHVTMLLPVLAWAYLELGDMTAAERWSKESIRRATQAGYQVPLVEALRVRGLLLGEQNRLKEAEQMLEQSLAVSRALAWPYAEVKTLFAYGCLLHRAGKDQEATARLQAALALSAPRSERLYAAKIEATLTMLE